MSVPLREEKRSEAPLITFTLCVPAAVGVVVLAAFFESALAISDGSGVLLQPGLLLLLVGGSALILTTVGMLASMVHLAKPIRAPLSLRHLSSSWLSREIAVVSLFWGCVVIWVGGALLDSALCAAAGLVCAAVFGIVLLFVIARAYKVSTRPAWLGCECLLELIASACGAGAAMFLLCLSVCAGIRSVTQGTVDGSSYFAFACVMVACLFLVAGVALDACAHKSRYRRLLLLQEASDERVALTLENYRDLGPVVRKAWRIEVGAAIIGLVGVCLYGAILASGGFGFAFVAGAVALFALATVLEFIAHGMQRWLFYEIPIPVRYIALLRK